MNNRSELEVIAMEEGVTDIGAIYKDAFTSLTQQMTGIQLKHVDGGETLFDKKRVFLVDTTGPFKSTIECDIAEDLFHCIALNLNNGQEITEDVEILYMTEYMNIVCGRAVSSINSLLKSASRLTVPKYMGEGNGESKKQGTKKVQLDFTTEYGNMRVGLHYDNVEGGSVK
jgi:hypothetical protein